MERRRRQRDRATAATCVLALISEQPLYHSLAKCSFRVWTDAQSAFLDYRPAEYGLGPEAQGLFAALAAVCVPLGAAPTPSEFQHLLTDLLHHARSEEQIRQSLFGRVESVDRARLYAPELAAPLRALLASSSACSAPTKCSCRTRPAAPARGTAARSRRWRTAPSPASAAR